MGRAAVIELYGYDTSFGKDDDIEHVVLSVI